MINGQLNACPYCVLQANVWYLDSQMTGLKAQRTVWQTAMLTGMVLLQ